MTINLKPFNPSQEQLDYVKCLYESGNDVQAIAEHMDWSYWTVLKIIDQQDDRDIEHALLINELEHNK
jgi:hypothetical protein